MNGPSLPCTTLFSPSRIGTLAPGLERRQLRYAALPKRSTVLAMIEREPGERINRTDHAHNPSTHDPFDWRAVREGPRRANDGLEREFKVFNRLEGCVCTTCAPADQEKSCERQRGQVSEAGLGTARSGDAHDKSFRKQRRSEGRADLSCPRLRTS